MVTVSWAATAGAAYASMINWRGRPRQGQGWDSPYPGPCICRPKFRATRLTLGPAPSSKLPDLVSIALNFFADRLRRANCWYASVTPFLARNQTFQTCWAVCHTSSFAQSPRSVGSPKSQASQPGTPKLEINHPHAHTRGHLGKASPKLEKEWPDMEAHRPGLARPPMATLQDLKIRTSKAVPCAYLLLHLRAKLALWASTAMAGGTPLSALMLPLLATTLCFLSAAEGSALLPRDTPSADDYSWIHKWAAVGDSFTAGIGSGDGLYDDTDNSRECSRYDYTYPVCRSRRWHCEESGTHV